MIAWDFLSGSRWFLDWITPCSPVLAAPIAVPGDPGGPVFAWVTLLVMATPGFARTFRAGWLCWLWKVSLSWSSVSCSRETE